MEQIISLLTALLCALLAPLPLLAVVAVVFFVAFQSHKRLNERWRAFGQAHGLAFAGGGLALPQLRGTWQGAAVEACIFTRGSGKNRQTWTHASVRPAAPLPAGLRIHRHSVFSFLGQMLGLQDIQVGDPAFDQALVIKGLEPGEVQRFLAPAAVRQAILAFAQDGGRLEQERGCCLERYGAVTEGPQLQALLDAAVAAARALDQAREAAPAVVAPEREAAPAVVALEREAAPAVAVPAPEVAPAVAVLARAPEPIRLPPPLPEPGRR